MPPLAGLTTYGVARTNFRSPPRAIPPAGIHADVTAWKAAVVTAGGVVTSTQEQELSTFWTGLGSITAKLNFFWPLWTESAVTAAGAKIDLKTTLAASNIGSPSWAGGAGVTTNGSSAALDLNTLGGTSQNSVSFGFDLLNNISAVDGVQMGASILATSYSNNVSLQWTDGKLYCAARDDNGDTGVTPPAVRNGFSVINRTVSTQADYYKNGSLFSNNGRNSSLNSVNFNWTLGACRDEFNVIQQWSPGQYSMCFIGLGLLAADILAIHNGWATYKSSISA